MTIDRLIVMSLDRTPERFARFMDCKPSLPVERYSAVDSRTLDRDHCISNGLITSDNRYTMASVAIFASHVALWRRAITEERCLHVAEDDALLRWDFGQAASSALDGLEAWDFVLWGWNFDWPMKFRLAPGLGSAVVQGDQDDLRQECSDFFAVTIAPNMYPLISAAGSCCYSISPKGARRFLDLMLPIGVEPAAYTLDPDKVWANVTKDVEMSRHYENLNCFVSVPCLAVSLNIAEDSTHYNF